MSSFLIRGGASRPSGPPPLAVRDSTAAHGGDFERNVKVAKRAEVRAAPTRGRSRSPVAAKTTSVARGRPVDVSTRALYASTVGLSEGEGRAHIPGYAGFVANMKEVAGTSYTKCTARVLSTDPTDLVATDMIPADPHNTREITVEHSDKTRSSVITELLSRPRHVPGYTGHVPGLKDCPLGLSFSKYTETLLADKPSDLPLDATAARRALMKKSVGGLESSPYREKPRLVVKDVGLYLKYSGTTM